MPEQVSRTGLQLKAASGRLFALGGACVATHGAPGGEAGFAAAILAAPTHGVIHVSTPRLDLRYKSAVGNTLSELAILVTAREWTQDYEWYVHYPIALKAGIKPDVADSIAEGRRPTGLTDDEEIVVEFATELLRNKQVSDRTFARAEKRFGKKGVVDLTGIVSYYTLLAMQLNVAQYQMPKDGKPLVRFPH